jgi:ribosomal silencing factor RsfS
VVCDLHAISSRSTISRFFVILRVSSRTRVEALASENRIADKLESERRECESQEKHRNREDVDQFS